MKARSMSLILFLAFFLGLTAFLGHADTDTAESGTTQEIQTTDDNSKLNLNDPKVEVQVEDFEVQVEGIESEHLSEKISEKIKELLNKNKDADFVVDIVDVDVKVTEFDASGSEIRDSKKHKELESKIKGLFENSGFVSGLTESIKKLVEKKVGDSSNNLDNNHATVPTETDGLKKWVGQLAEKIGQIIQKLEGNNHQTQINTI